MKNKLKTTFWLVIAPIIITLIVVFLSNSNSPNTQPEPEKQQLYSSVFVQANLAGDKYVEIQMWFVAKEVQNAKLKDTNFIIKRDKDTIFTYQGSSEILYTFLKSRVNPLLEPPFIKTKFNGDEIGILYLGISPQTRNCIHISNYSNKSGMIISSEQIDQLFKKTPK